MTRFINSWPLAIIPIALGLSAVRADAQLASGWENQSTSPSLTTESAPLRSVKIANTSSTVQHYNLFLGPAVNVVAGDAVTLTITAEKISGTFPGFHVGFHVMDAKGVYQTEAGKAFEGTLSGTLKSLKYKFVATKAGQVRPRIAIGSIPAGANLEFAVSDKVSVVKVAAPAPTALPTTPPTSPTTPTTPTPTPGACTLAASGPVTATRNGQVIENLRIQADGRHGITVDGFSNVVIRNVSIEHKNGMGIGINNAPGLRIENASILYKGAPAKGPNPSFDHYNIGCTNSPNVVITRVRAEKGSSGVWMGNCQSPKISFLEGHDFRGPMPRGQLAQFDHSHDALLEDFSVENDGEIAWTEDNVNVWRSSRATIRRGLVDGNNSPSGIGVIFEHDDGVAKDGLVEDVDAVHQGNGCFSGYPGTNVTFTRTRCSDNICTSQQGRGKPMSNALAWAGEPSSSNNLKIYDSTYQRLCNPGNVVWDRNKFSVAEVKEASFTPRAPLRLKFCF